MKYVILISFLSFMGCATPTLVETNYQKISDELDHWKPNVVRYSVEVGIVLNTLEAKYNMTKMKCNQEFRKVKYEKVSRYRKSENADKRLYLNEDYKKNEGFEIKEEIKYTKCESIKIPDDIYFMVSWAGEKFKVKEAKLDKLPDNVLEKLIEWRKKEDKDKKNPQITVYYDGHEINAVARSNRLADLADAAIYNSKKN